MNGLRIGLACAAAVLPSFLFSGVAFAVIGPDGQPIPKLGPATACGATTNEWGNIQPCLDNSEISLGGMAGAVRAQPDATVDQEVFDPHCQLKFKVIQRGGDYASVFGWYPATPGSTTPPAPKDMHVMLTCRDEQDPNKAAGVDWTDPVGTEKTLTVPAGTGKVGFFMSNNLFDCAGMIASDGAGGEVLAKLGTNTAYSQKALNKGPGGNYMVLQWQSAQNPDAFYFGWEDNYEGTDSDYEDLLTLVMGVDCAEGGAECDTGKLGICKPGTMQCRNGGLECVPDNDPHPEKCNNIDDDCNDVIDDGDGLCDPNYVCLDGVCVGDCSTGEFPCPTGYECAEKADGKHHCVEKVCIGVPCPAGERCVGGQCIGDCKDVVCPWGQNCQSGVCVPACANQTCDQGFVCVVRDEGGTAKGVCQNCPCKGCPDGTTCDAGYCRPNDCVGVTCALGTHCVGGNCVDDCQGAKCPFGGTCTNGVCSGSGGTGGTGGSGGTGEGGTGNIIVTGGSGGSGADGTGATGTGATGSGGDNEGDPSSRGRGTTTGCACRTGAEGGNGALPWLGLGLLAAALRRRKVPRSR